MAPLQMEFFLQYQKPHKLLSHSLNKACANYLLLNVFQFTVLYVTEGNQQKHIGRSTAKTLLCYSDTRHKVSQ